MSRDPRLLDEGADSFEAALLRSAAQDGASADRARTLAALGLATGTTAASQTSAGAIGKGMALWAMKGIAAGGFVAVSAVVVVAATRHPAPRFVPALHSAAAAIAPPIAPRGPVAAVPPAPEPLGLRSDVPESNSLPPASSTRPGRRRSWEPAPARTTATEALPEFAVGTPPERTSAQGGGAPPAPVAIEAIRQEEPPAVLPDALLEEVAILDRARGLLTRHEGEGALREADTYLTRFPDGRLGAEAKIIRIYALLLTKGPSAAAPEARAFLREHPASPHAPRLREVVRNTPEITNP